MKQVNWTLTLPYTVKSIRISAEVVSKIPCDWLTLNITGSVSARGVSSCSASYLRITGADLVDSELGTKH